MSQTADTPPDPDARAPHGHHPSARTDKARAISCLNISRVSAPTTIRHTDTIMHIPCFWTHTQPSSPATHRVRPLQGPLWFGSLPAAVYPDRHGRRAWALGLGQRPTHSPPHTLTHKLTIKQHPPCHQRMNRSIQCLNAVGSKSSALGGRTLSSVERTHRHVGRTRPIASARGTHQRLGS